ncbi:S-adenosyl-L-methionine-dependent methyltransferase [Kickxella alabastrina]|uniref:S-adenosyl-L-methionine-dependent methyltransferase n=1 Tax=Kickxella alabastrina TaxID=61397 RepID=UPI00221F4064|nr:S-adenosyl-L-methionine-dependent methyltransferase [Kickxella alabastrina]KAI7834725.1 S-adenosyl-L-methionine-dependent methyltransferase [Kickxella alabastrina]
MDETFIADAKDILAKDTSVIPDFWQNKYKNEASKNWDKFYNRNTTNFYKDRHWTDREFEELRPSHIFTEHKPVLLEIGCGVGNFVWPILERNPDIFVYACDFSLRAVGFVQSNENYTESRCQAFVCDITKDRLADTIPPHSVDIVSAIFVFSALPPEKQADAVANVIEILKPGGRILFRDYALYDLAQLRFKSGHKLEDNLYVRQDGTLSYYFSKERLRELFVQHGGLVEIENDYVVKKLINAKLNIDSDRIFAQAKFQAPITTTDYIDASAGKTQSIDDSEVSVE